MSTPESPTPSMDLPVARNSEHMEAKQEAVNRERHAYIKTLTREEQTKFSAVEKAVGILEKAKVPFFLWARPDPTRAEGAAVWEYNKLTYLGSFTEEGNGDSRENFTRIMHTALHSFAKYSGFVVPVYTQQQELVAIYGAPQSKPDET